MKIAKCSLLLFFLSGFFLAIAGGDPVEKKITREFKIQSNGLLGISNKYGNIDIAIGESNKIKMDVKISVKASSQRKAQETLDRIQIRFEESSNQVTARTEIESSSKWSSWFTSGNVDIDVDYHVLVPADIYLDLTNKYGDIYVETTNKDMKIELGFGDIRLGDVNAKLTLKMDYSEGSLSNIMDGDLNLSYSDLEMEDAQSLTLNMKYTDLVMGSALRLKWISAFSDFQGQNIDELIYSGKYDDVVIDRVKTLDIETGFSDVTISGLTQKGNLSMKYGDLHITNIGRGFTRLDVNTSFTGVVLDFAEGASFTLDAQNNFCDIQHSGLQVTEDIKKSTSTILKARRGTGDALVHIRMNYGDLRIK